MAAQSPETGAGVITSTTGLQPDLAGHMDRPLRYSAQNGDFVITKGTEFFNRSLYGGNTAFRVDGGDKPEFMMYLPRRGGNLRLGLQSGKRVTFDCSTQLTSRGQDATFREARLRFLSSHLTRRKSSRASQSALSATMW